MAFDIRIVFILYITFSQCIKCNAFFEDLYENIVSAQDTLSELSSALKIGLQSVAQTAKFLEKFLESTIEEDCIYKCPKKDEVAVSKPYYEPRADGCGSMGLYLEGKDLPRLQMVDCCNEHDKCYDKCGSDKEECDKKFKRCLYKTCDDTKGKTNKINLQMCQGGAKLLYTATMALGCNSFKEAQGRACICKKVRTEL